MRMDVLALMILFAAGPALAQPLDIPDDSSGLIGANDDSSAPTMEDLEDGVKPEGPILVEPKLNVIEEPADTGGAGNLYREDPKPTPGLRIKVPTD